MNQEENIPDNRSVRYIEDDEIDLFDLLKTLWKWKWFVLGLTVAGFIAALLFLTLKPEEPATYTATTDIQIGKIANVNVESVGDIYAYLQSDDFVGSNKGLRDIDIAVNNFENILFTDSKSGQYILNGEEGFRYTLVLTLSTTGKDPDIALNRISKAASKLAERHRDIYSRGRENYENYRPKLKELQEESVKYLPLHWLDSYTYPTRVIKAASVNQNVSEDRTAIILSVSTLAALFLSVLLAFFIEAIRNRIEAERKTAK